MEMSLPSNAMILVVFILSRFFRNLSLVFPECRDYHGYPPVRIARECSYGKQQRRPKD
jgi:hypothetical protein